MPAVIGLMPMPTCSSNGINNGIAPLPMRENRLPRMPMRKLETWNSVSENNGSRLLAACSQ
ncbi:hypothetical protein D3C81_1879960 [compost metagenome]